MSIDNPRNWAEEFYHKLIAGAGPFRPDYREGLTHRQCPKLIILEENTGIFKDKDGRVSNKVSIDKKGQKSVSQVRIHRGVDVSTFRARIAYETKLEKNPNYYRTGRSKAA